MAGPQQSLLCTLSPWVKTQETPTQERPGLSDWVALLPMSSSPLTVLIMALFRPSCPVSPWSNDEAQRMLTVEKHNLQAGAVLSLSITNA